MSELTPRPYDPTPCYPPVGDGTVSGWDAAVASLPEDVSVLAVDGPAVARWPRLLEGLTTALRARGLSSASLDMREHLLPWQQVVKLTSTAELADDPDFARLAEGTLADLFATLPSAELLAATRGDRAVLVVYGPGAGLVAADQIWYADLPKRYAEAAIVAGEAGNLGQPAADTRAGTTKRLFYVDWPLLDRHRDALAPRIDRWIDTQDVEEPVSLSGATLRASLAAMARRPFRTRPTFNTTSWGGHWGQRRLGMNPDARNTALGYELIAPESGVLLGTGGAFAEVPFQLAVALHPEEVLGAPVHARFGTSFPIRFDYLDTVDGGSLSVHCHPRSDYMSRVFGWPYTQHETYYMMVGGEDNRVFLGLREGADIELFHEQAHAANVAGVPFDITRHVGTFPATPHQLFLIPAGTPHGSGEGNVVLEISATPYLYSLRFYDWLRRDADGGQRPVHVEHAFNNLNADRIGDAVAHDLVQRPRVVRRGNSWHEELIGSLPEMFFEVRRTVLEPQATATDATADRFHILNVVDGQGVVITTDSGDTHSVAYAETLVVPASVGGYRLRAVGDQRVMVVKSLVSS